MDGWMDGKERKDGNRSILPKLEVPAVFSSDPCEEESGDKWLKINVGEKTCEKIYRMFEKKSCIEAEVRNQMFVGKLLRRSIRFTFLRKAKWKKVFIEFSITRSSKTRKAMSNLRPAATYQPSHLQCCGLPAH